MPLLCPKCGVQIQPDAVECGMCLRRRTRKQIFAGYRNLEAAAKGPSLGEKFRKGASIAGVAGLVGALVVAIKMNFTQPPPAPAPSPSQPLAADPVPGSNIPDGETPSASAGFSSERPRDLPGGFREEGVPGARPVCTIKGKTYDLISLKGIAGVRLIFKDSETGEEAEVVTDRSGSYSIGLKLLEEGGYLAAVSREGYLEDYLEDMEPSYSTQDIVRRREALNLSATSRILHVPISPESTAREFRYDIFLLPSR